jgi:glycosyltransferase involved in cell wall biosynthesis
MISFIIPFYNKHIFINECVDSLRNQISNSDEIIIIDDGSEVPLKNNFQIDNLKIIRKSNGGVSSARNCGILAAKNNYLFFLDSDDYIVDFSIEKIKSHISSNNNAEILAFNYYRLINDIYKKNMSFNSGELDLLSCLSKYNFPFNSSSLVVKKDFLLTKNIFFNETLTFGEDQLFWIKCCLNGSIYYINEFLSVYRYDTDLSTSVILRNDVQLNVNLIKNLFKLYLEFGDKRLLKIIDQQIFQTCKLCFLNHDFHKLRIYSRLLRNIKYRFLLYGLLLCKYFIKTI